MPRSLAFFLSIVLSIASSPAFAQPTPFNSVDDAAKFADVLEIPGQYINDHALIRVGGEWHLFYTVGIVAPPPQLAGSRTPVVSEVGTSTAGLEARGGDDDSSRVRWWRDGNEVSIGHAVSTDLMTWKILPVALTVGPPGSIDAGHVYSPTVFRRDSAYYMIYTATDGSHFRAEHLCMATSRDLMTWRRVGDTAVFNPDPSWALYFDRDSVKGRPGPVSARDPHVIFVPDVGYLLYYVARLRPSPADSLEGPLAAVALASSPDLVHWKDHGPVMIRRVRGEDYYTYTHPESPTVFHRGRFWYLFWKGGSGTRFIISDNPFDFRNREAYWLGSSHASEIVEWGRDWYITSCSRGVEDFIHGATDRTRGLYLAKLNWLGFTPVLAKIEAR